MLMLTRAIDEVVIVESNDVNHPAIAMEILGTVSRHVRLKFVAAGDGPILVRRDPENNSIHLSVGER